MDSNEDLINITYNIKEQQEIILNNTILMLSRRMYYDDTTDKKLPLLDFTTAIKNIKYESTINIVNCNNKDTYSIFLSFSDIVSSSQNSIINDFTRDNSKYKKILIVPKIHEKIKHFALSSSIEIFDHTYMMCDLLNIFYQPQYELLSPKEMTELINTYGNKYTYEKLTYHDPIRQYFNLSKGNIIRIIRPSLQSGYTIAYRIVG